MVRVERAAPAQYDEIGAVTVAAYGPFLLGRDDPYTTRLADVALRDREAEVWVALDDDGTVLGNVTYCPPGSAWREISRGTEGEFRMLAVAPAAQGRGVGRLLATTVIDRFGTEGATAVVLSSLATMGAAHALYASLGFRRAPERDWTPLPGVDLLAFALELPRLEITGAP